MDELAGATPELIGVSGRDPGTLVKRRSHLMDLTVVRALVPSVLLPAPARIHDDPRRVEEVLLENVAIHEAVTEERREGLSVRGMDVPDTGLQWRQRLRQSGRWSVPRARGS